MKRLLVSPEEWAKFVRLLYSDRTGEHMEDTIRRFLKDHPDCVHRTSMQFTPLFYACQSNNICLAKILLELGANVNEGWVDFDGGSPLFAAAESGNVDAVRLLIDHGVSIHSIMNYVIRNEKVFECGTTALKTLLNVTSDVDLETSWHDAEGELVRGSYLHLALAEGSSLSASLLLECGKFDVNALDSRGNSALLLAICNKLCNGLVKDILRTTKDVEFANNSGEYPLLLATKRADIGVIFDILSAHPHLICR
jgi:ankyrin repeat protein